jgi:serine/threonine protein kinase
VDQSYFSDQSYIYAAPEVITPRGKKVGRLADVFSLGCIFLAMMTVVKGQSLSTFHAYRASSTHDASFHANLDRVSNWRMRLQTISGPAVAAQPQRREQAMKIETSVLEYIETMIRADPSKRIKMRRLASSVAWWSEAKSGAGLLRRRSLDGINGINGMNGMSGLNGLNGISGLNGMNGMGGLNGLVGLNGVNGINMGRTDLGQLEGYYNQRRHEDAATTWGAK